MLCVEVEHGIQFMNRDNWIKSINILTKKYTLQIYSNNCVDDKTQHLEKTYLYTRCMII